VIVRIRPSACPERHVVRKPSLIMANESQKSGLDRKT
jgi:hypothetical protein